MKLTTLIFTIFIPILLFSQTISMGEPIPFEHGRKIIGNADLGYFSHEWKYFKERSFHLLDKTSFKKVKTITIDDSYYKSHIINNKAVLFFKNKGELSYKELDLKTGKTGDSNVLIKYDNEKYPVVKMEFKDDGVLVLLSSEEAHYTHFVRGAEYHAGLSPFESFTGKVFAFDLNFDERYQSDLDFSLNKEKFHLRDLKFNYSNKERKFYVITDIVTSGTTIKQTTVMEFKRYLNTIDEEGENVIEEIGFDEGNLIFGYNIIDGKDGENIGQRLIMDKETGKMKIQTFQIDNNNNVISEKNLDLLSHHTFDVNRYLSENGFFLSSDVIKNEVLENGNVLSLYRINLDHSKYWSGSKYKNYYFIEMNPDGIVVDIKGVPVFDRNGASISDNRFFYSYDEGVYNIVYIDNYANQKDKYGKKLDGNYLVAATIDEEGNLNKNILTHEQKYEKTSIYRLLKTCFVINNETFITYAYKKKKEDVPFTIKF